MDLLNGVYFPHLVKSSLNHLSCIKQGAETESVKEQVMANVLPRPPILRIYVKIH